MKYKDILVSGSKNLFFKSAFQTYFDEIGNSVKDWESLFCQMDEDENNFSYLRLTEENDIIGFIQFKLINLKNWFFDEPMGFIREFWISKEYRKKGHGKALLSMAENYFIAKGVYKSILTTNSAEKFYLSRGYEKDKGITAVNNMEVFIKKLSLLKS